MDHRFEIVRYDETIASLVFAKDNSYELSLDLKYADVIRGFLEKYPLNYPKACITKVWDLAGYCRGLAYDRTLHTEVSQ